MSGKTKLCIGIIILMTSVLLFTACGTKDLNETNKTKTSDVTSSSVFDTKNESRNNDASVSRKFSANKSASENNGQSSDSAQSSGSHSEQDGYVNNEAPSENNGHNIGEPNTNEITNDAGNSNSTNNSNIQNNSEETTNSEPKNNTCSFTIDCVKAIASNELSESMRDLLPKDGVIYKNQTLEFNLGETAFDILFRITQQNGIPMEFSATPAFGSKYIEGISSLYEFDCGEGSGWKYAVNGESLNYGCSQYTVKPHDSIIFYYTTDWGNDL